MFNREILFTDDLGPAIRLILKYREYPRLHSHCEALLFDLYRRKGEHKMAAIISHNLSMVSLRSLPNMLASTAKQKILVNQEYLPEPVFEMERLVSRHPHDPNFGFSWASFYHLSAKTSW